MSESRDLSLRFGTPKQYREAFKGFDWSNIMGDLKRLETNPRNKQLKELEQYEISRQRFLKLLGREKMIWQPTSEKYDLDVEVSRIYVYNREQFVAFMRIHPRGFRSERVVPAGKEMFFYLLTGFVMFHVEKRVTKNMSRGQYVKVPPRATYSIRCPHGDGPSYLLFKVNDSNAKPLRTPAKRNSANTNNNTNTDTNVCVDAESNASQ